MKSIYTLILVAFVALMVFTFTGCGDNVQQQPQQEAQLVDDNPVNYENAYDNELIDIDIDLGGGHYVKRKVKRGDYNTGRYKSFRRVVPTPAPVRPPVVGSTPIRTSSTPIRTSSTPIRTASTPVTSRPTSAPSSPSRPVSAPVSRPSTPTYRPSTPTRIR